jgi:hypothetical protein
VNTLSSGATPFTIELRSGTFVPLLNHSFPGECMEEFGLLSIPLGLLFILGSVAVLFLTI